MRPAVQPSSFIWAWCLGKMPMPHSDSPKDIETQSENEVPVLPGGDLEDELGSDPATEEALGKLLEERWKEYLANPEAVITLEELRSKYGLKPLVD